MMAILIKDNHDEFINDIINLSMRTSAAFFSFPGV